MGLRKKIGRTRQNKTKQNKWEEEE